MAGVDIAEQIQDSFLSCTICFQPFNRPKALPCLHTFCEGCLRDYVASRFEGTGKFPCPLCRQTRPIPLKIFSADRRERKGVVALNFEELLEKAKQKFNIRETVAKIVLDEDGTEVDEEFFPFIRGESVLMLLKENETWTRPQAVKDDVPVNSADEKLDELIKKIRGSKKKTKTEKKTRRVQIGWAHFELRQKRYVQVRSQQGGGTPFISLDIEATYEEVRQKLIEEFFPNGKSLNRKKLKNLQVELGSLKGEKVTAATFSVSSYFKDQNRMYLLTKTKDVIATIMSAESESDSDFELPEIPFKKRQRTETVTQPTQQSTSTQVHSTLTDQETQPGDPESDPPYVRAGPSSQNLTTVEETESTSFSDTALGLSGSSPQPVSFHVSNSSVTHCDSGFIGSMLHVNAGTPTVSYNLFSAKCTICFERDREAFFLPCGHTLCMACAVYLECNHKSAGCPFCKKDIKGIGQIRF